jgi:NADPH:quinone reductase
VTVLGVATMRATRLTSPGRVEVESVRQPVPGPGEVLIRLEGSGVCASNLELWSGQPWFSYPLEPGAPGHEGWGYVEATGPGVDGFREGDRVTFLSGRAYAEYDVAASDQVVRLPHTLDGRPFPGEPLGCAINIFRRSGVQPGTVVAIVGVGFLGSLLTKLASDAGARVIAITRRAWALEVARSMGAAETVIMDDHRGVIQQVEELTDGRLCDTVIECAGRQWPLDLAAEITGERRTLVIAGYHQDGPRQVDMRLWNWRGLDVINAHERDPRVYVEAMRAAVEVVSSGGLEPDPLFTHRYPLSELGLALDATRDRPDGFMKALVAP